MTTKIDAARIAITAGCSTLIALGANTTADGGPIAAVAAGTARGTWFLADISPETARRQWLAGALKPTGSVRVDAGAARALRSGRKTSLLAAGVTAVAGRFERGDAIDVIDPDGATIARGVSAYSSEDAAKLLGRKSDEFESILGYRGRPALIHVDDLVLVG
jgi:glutamate 5-kinase